MVENFGNGAILMHIKLQDELKLDKDHCIIDKKILVELLRKNEERDYFIQKQTRKEECNRVQQETIDAMCGYINGKISFEKCANILNMNFYELDEFCRKRCSLEEESVKNSFKGIIA